MTSAIKRQLMTLKADHIVKTVQEWADDNDIPFDAENSEAEFPLRARILLSLFEIEG